MMQVNVSTKAVIGTLSTVALGIASWVLLGIIDHSGRIRDPESDAKEDTRQDEELREIRKTMQDMVILFFHEHEGVHGTSPPLAEVGSHPDEPVAVPEARGSGGSDADETFSAVQMDLESALRSLGIEPARTAPPRKDPR